MVAIKEIPPRSRSQALTFRGARSRASSPATARTGSLAWSGARRHPAPRNWLLRCSNPTRAQSPVVPLRLALAENARSSPSPFRCRRGGTRGTTEGASVTGRPGTLSSPADGAAARTVAGAHEAAVEFPRRYGTRPGWWRCGRAEPPFWHGFQSDLVGCRKVPIRMICARPRARRLNAAPPRDLPRRSGPP
jgi:hypothetical protein